MTQLPERQLPPSWQGSVVVDIGGDIGALVLRVPPELDGHEIDLRPDNSSQPNTHSLVRERRFPLGSSYAAVYPSLLAGSYTVVGAAQRFAIEGGRVTDIELQPGALIHLSHEHPNPGHAHSHARAL
jgi:hypothetical protein